MKKEYKKPEMQVIEMQHAANLLAGSGSDPNWYPGDFN